MLCEILSVLSSAFAMNSLNCSNLLYKEIRVSIPWDTHGDTFILSPQALHHLKLFYSYEILIFSSFPIFHLCDRTVCFFFFNLSVTLPLKSALGCLAGLDLKLEMQAGGVGICISKICPPPSAGKQSLPNWHWKLVYIKLLFSDILWFVLGLGSPWEIFNLKTNGMQTSDVMS